MDDATPNPEVRHSPTAEFWRKVVQSDPEVITDPAERTLLIQVSRGRPAQRAGHTAVSPNPMEKTRTPPVSSLSPWAFSQRLNSAASFFVAVQDQVGQVKRSITCIYLNKGPHGPGTPHASSPHRGRHEPSPWGSPGPRHPGGQPGHHPSTLSLFSIFIPPAVTNSEKRPTFLAFCHVPSSCFPSPSSALWGMLKGLEL